MSSVPRRLVTSLPGAQGFAPPLANAVRAGFRLPGYLRQWPEVPGPAWRRPLRIRDAYPRRLPDNARRLRTTLTTSTSPSGQPDGLSGEPGGTRRRRLARALRRACCPRMFPSRSSTSAHSTSPVDNLRSVRGSLERLPMETQSVRSLSCLHVIEHIGWVDTATLSTRMARARHAQSSSASSPPPASSTSLCRSDASECASTRIVSTTPNDPRLPSQPRARRLRSRR